MTASKPVPLVLDEKSRDSSIHMDFTLTQCSKLHIIADPTTPLPPSPRGSSLPKHNTCPAKAVEEGLEENDKEPKALTLPPNSPGPKPTAPLCNALEKPNLRKPACDSLSNSMISPEKPIVRPVVAVQGGTEECFHTCLHCFKLIHVNFWDQCSNSNVLDDTIYSSLLHVIRKCMEMGSIEYDTGSEPIWIAPPITLT